MAVETKIWVLGAFVATGVLLLVGVVSGNMRLCANLCIYRYL